MEQEADKAPIRAPVCPDCHKPMHFRTSEPDRAIPNLRHAMFVCDCGRASDQVVSELPRKLGMSA
jgi:hypothetical protein